MRAVRHFTITPHLPEPIAKLEDIAMNLRWNWHSGARALFRDVSPELWEAHEYNPILVLRGADQHRLNELAGNPSFIERVREIADDFECYVSATDTWYARAIASSGPVSPPQVAYFSAEFGLTEIIPIFAGGLGILAGDHVKSASDLGVPLIGVGLLYQTGYFRQRIDSEGWQQAMPRENDFASLPIELERDGNGNPITIAVGLPGRDVHAQIWRADVGRAQVYLLDANLEQNEERDQRITRRLYDADPRLRIKQEILLGIGGARAIQALGLEPPIIHLNEGHAAFAGLERIRRLMEQHGLTFSEAREAACAGTVFTTHTPVAAGHDRFPPAIIDYYFNEYWQSLGLHRNQFHGLGRQNPADDNELFTMTILALKLAAYRGGVSRLHGDVSRRMWQSLWPGAEVDEVPIGSITNGIHLNSWLAPEIADLFDRHLSRPCREEPLGIEEWSGIDQVSDSELWDVHQQLRHRLIEFARHRLSEQEHRVGMHPADIRATENILDPNALTIGFARRFATYKRGALLLHDRSRLARILSDANRPVQFIFAGKAHPDDQGGKEVIQTLVSAIQDAPFEGKIIFLEDYDISIARYMVQGVDVWLNNPRRPLEASGTSGMKVAANGGLNLSTLDGWWDEAWNISQEKSIPLGWTIGDGATYEDPAYADAGDARALYNLLEHCIIPRFYERGDDGLPHEWIAMMRASMREFIPRFNTHRMVEDYVRICYLPALEVSERLREDEFSAARALDRWKRDIAAAWKDVRISVEDGGRCGALAADETITVDAVVSLGSLRAEDVRVELIWGPTDQSGQITVPNYTPMTLDTANQGTAHYRAELRAPGSGTFGYTARALPAHPNLLHPIDLGLLAWATGCEKPDTAAAE
ncbi:MAG: alpha-glucan family phosphorylase [Chloroflexota bacterium]